MSHYDWITMNSKHFNQPLPNALYDFLCNLETHCPYADGEIIHNLKNELKSHGSCLTWEKCIDIMRSDTSLASGFHTWLIIYHDAPFRQTLLDVMAEIMAEDDEKFYRG